MYDGLNDAQKQYANSLLESVENQQKLTLEAKATAEAAQKNADDATRELRSSTVMQGNNEQLTKYLSSGDLKGEIEILSQLKKGTEEYEKQYDSLIASFRDAIQPTKEQEQLLIKVVEAKVNAAEQTQKYSNQVDVLDNETLQFNKRLQELVQGHHNGYLSTQELIQALENEKAKFSETSEEAKKLQAQIDKLQNSNQGVFGANFAQNLTNSFKGISQLTMGINSLSSAFDALGNKDLSTFEKIQRFATGVSFGAPSLMMGGKQAGKDIAGILNGVTNYFNQKQSNSILDEMIGNNKARIDEIKNTLNNSTGNV